LPAGEAQAIAALDEAKRAIAVAMANEDVDALLEWRDRAQAVQHYLTRRSEAKEIADNAGEVKVRAEAALGKLDLAASPGRGRPKGEDDKDKDEEPAPAPLAEFEGHRRSMFRTLGRLDNPQLDTVVTGLRSEDDGGITTSRAVRAAREILPKEEKESAPGKPTKEARREVVADYVGHLRALDTETSTLVRMARKMVPMATANERSRMASRLGNTITRLEELREGLDTDAEPAAEDVEETE
jgi:hypothetical protein